MIILYKPYTNGLGDFDDWINNAMEFKIRLLLGNHILLKPNFDI